MKSFFGRGGTSTSKSSGAGRRRLTLAVALSVSLLAGLAFSVAALANTHASSPGPYTIPTDTSTVQTGTTYTVTTGSDSPTTTSGWQPAPAGYTAPANDGLGVTPGSVKHVWVIVLENKAYDASFTPLEGTQGSYLDALPEEGALLTNYYGTGHSSLDNYVTMASGQAPQADDQDDCPGYTALSGATSDSDGSNIVDGIDLNGTLASNPNYGQFVSAAGPDAPAGDNGCVYPSSVPTIFNQLDAASESWKVYAQDLDTTNYAPAANQNAGTAVCGAPDPTVGATPTAALGNAGSTNGASFGNDGSANANSQYVSKHNPLPWFDSILSGTDCAKNLNTGSTFDSTTGNAPGNSDHLATLFGPNDQLDTDLQSASTTPDFSFIVPNNCSNGHDAVCAGDNLSGGFTNAADAAGQTGQIPNSTPTNYTGGTYSESLFLQHIIPEIESSAAFQQNGLIVVTYDESYPPFTWQNSFANSTLLPSTAAGSLVTDEAGESLYGRSLNWEPTGPNATLVQGPNGQALTPGPGYNENIDRPGTTADGSVQSCSAGTTANGYSYYDTVTGTVTSTSTTFTSPSPTAPTYCESGAAGTPTSASAQSNVSIASGSSTALDVASNPGTTAPAQTTLKNEGEEVTAWSGTAPTFTDNATGNASYTGPVYVGNVINTAETATAGSAATPKGEVFSGQFQLVDAQGNLLTSNASYNGSATLHWADTDNDPFYDAFDPTTGGGDAGAVLISPFIKPGTVSNTYYNHYSLLRSLEDIFQVNTLATGSSSGYTGTISLSNGLDNDGHIGYAAQPGLTPFGSDVFTNVAATVSTVTQTTTVTTPGGTTTVTAPGGTTTVTTPGGTKTVVKVEAVVPDVIGDPLSKAKAAITADGLKVGTIKGKGAAVASESPHAGSRVDAGTKVDLTLKK